MAPARAGSATSCDGRPAQSVMRWPSGAGPILRRRTTRRWRSLWALRRGRGPVASRAPSYLSATDLFCGAGGSSIGAEAAGVSLVMGINHWVRAIETHSTNFPRADHDCRDVSDQHPSRYPATHLLLASPECTNYSQAKGRKRHAVRGQLGLDGIEPIPVEAEERSRATMWDVVRFAEHHGYQAIVVENVVDAWDWALLPAWFAAMDALGYDHRALFLNSMFFDGV